MSTEGRKNEYFQPTARKLNHREIKGFGSKKSVATAEPISTSRDLVKEDSKSAAILNNELKETKESLPVVQGESTPLYTGLDGLLGHKVIIVRRAMEWGNIIMGFEQANKYELVNEEGHIVGFMAEEDSMLKTVGRQIMKGHRSFKVTIFDGTGNKVLEVNRPMYLVSSSLFVNKADGEKLGEVHMDWHLFKRRYKLLHKEQPFAYVDAGFLGVDFDMKNKDEKSISRVSLDWTTLPKMLFTDANAYSLRFDPEEGAPAMELEERAITLALAVSVDHDYFSRHGGGVGFLPFMPFGGHAPVPTAGETPSNTSNESPSEPAGPFPNEGAVEDKPWTFGKEEPMNQKETEQSSWWDQPSEEGKETTIEKGGEGGDGDGNWWDDLF